MRRVTLITAAVLAFIGGAFLIVLRRRDTAPAAASPVEGVVTERPPETMTRDELYEVARELDIPGRSKMKKPELKDAISRAERSG
jgi:hypothetical protein